MTPTDETEPLIQDCSNCGSPLDVSDYEPLADITCPVCETALKVERSFNQFILTSALGEGGMGTVYKALDTSLNRTVALKLLRKEFNADAEYLAKLDMEAKITASINHPHVVKVLSFGSAHGQVYIAMELVDKGTLDDLIELQGRVAELQALEVGCQAAMGLLAAHERGLIHRDVKPGNILFAEAHTAKISDFGLAILAEREAEVRGEIWGTPYYVAPEKLNNEPEDFRSDMYSLGATLFHALAGRPPFEASSASMVALKHLKSQAVSLQAFAPDVSDETAYVINRMLNKDPLQRYQSYEELIEHLKYAHDSLSSALDQGATRERERVVIESQAQQTFVGWMTFSLLLIVVVAGILLFVFRDKFFGSSMATEEVSAMGRAPAIIARGEPDAILTELKASLGQTTSLKDRTIARLVYATGLLVDGYRSDTDLQFTVLSQAGPYSTDPTEKPFADLVLDIAKKMENRDPIPPSEAANYSNNGPASIALLIFGLKDWQLEEIANCIPFFEKFLAGKQENTPWLIQLRPMAEGCLADAKVLVQAEKEITANPGNRPAILASLKDLKEKPSAPGVLGDVTKSLVKELE